MITFVYLQVADVAVFPSETESFCLGILEAMCFCCPSVARAVGGIPEVIEDEVSGILLPTAEVGALAEAIQRLINEPGLRRQLGEAAQERARTRFSAATIVPQYEALYARVCRSR